MTKYNRLISIEEELAQRGFLGRLLLKSSSLVFFIWTERETPVKGEESEVVPSVLENTHLSLSVLDVKGIIQMWICLSGRMKTPYLESVNWLPNYTQGQMLSQPSFSERQAGTPEG